MLAIAHLFPCFSGLLFGKFCNDRFQSGHWLCGGFAYCYTHDGGRRHRNRRAKPDKPFFRFLLPLRAAESLGGRREPLDGVGSRARFFIKLPKLERHHGVVRALIQCG